MCKGDAILEEHIELELGQEESFQEGALGRLLESLKDKVDELVPDILRLSDKIAHANIVDLVEETLVTRTLKECGYNQVKAARLLGVSRNTLRHRMKKYNIRFPARQ